jgi:hypothetical protein
MFTNTKATGDGQVRNLGVTLLRLGMWCLVARELIFAKNRAYSQRILQPNLACQLLYPVFSICR